MDKLKLTSAKWIHVDTENGPVGKYALDKSIDEYEHMYRHSIILENFRDAGRPVRPTPIYENLKVHGAVFAETFGWERAKWFDSSGDGEKYSFRRNNSYESVEKECIAVRERVGLLDLTCFAKVRDRRE